MSRLYFFHTSLSSRGFLSVVATAIFIGFSGNAIAQTEHTLSLKESILTEGRI